MDDLAVRGHLFGKFPIRPVFAKDTPAKARNAPRFSCSNTDGKSNRIICPIRHLYNLNASVACRIVGTETTIQKFLSVDGMMLEVGWRRSSRLRNVCQGYFMSAARIEFEGTEAVSSQVLVRPKKVRAQIVSVSILAIRKDHPNKHSALWPS